MTCEAKDDMKLCYVLHLSCLIVVYHVLLNTKFKLSVFEVETDPRLIDEHMSCLQPGAELGVSYSLHAVRLMYTFFPFL